MFWGEIHKVFFSQSVGYALRWFFEITYIRLSEGFAFTNTILNQQIADAYELKINCVCAVVVVRQESNQGGKNKDNKNGK